MAHAQRDAVLAGEYPALSDKSNAVSGRVGLRVAF
jgi:hypothetical protein